MRTVLTIFILFIQLTGFFTAEAKVAVQSHKGYPCIAASPVNQHHAAEIVQSAHFTYTSFKLRNQRLQAGLLFLTAANGYIPVQLHRIETIYVPPFCPSLVRLLLFPNHYFW